MSEPVNSVENDIKVLWHTIEELQMRIQRIEETIFEDADLLFDDA